MLVELLFGYAFWWGLFGGGDDRGRAKHNSVKRGRDFLGRYKTVSGECFRCDGTGRVYGRTCRKCGGSGRYSHTIRY